MGTNNVANAEQMRKDELVDLTHLIDHSRFEWASVFTCMSLNSKCSQKYFVCITMIVLSKLTTISSANQYEQMRNRTRVLTA